MKPNTLDKLMRLSQLRLTPEQARLVLADLDAIITLIDEMQGICTDGTEPLAHPLQADQPLRADAVTEEVSRERHQAIAPLTRDGLYLVPKVVE